MTATAAGYSRRTAAIGSRSAARRAGSSVAASATPPSSAAAPMIVAASMVPAFGTTLPRNLASANAPLVYFDAASTYGFSVATAIIASKSAARR